MPETYCMFEQLSGLKINFLKVRFIVLASVLNMKMFMKRSFIVNLVLFP
jgi:hypothetical protein